MTLQEKIKAMVDKGFSYTQLSKIVECSPTTLTSWMRGQTKISKRMEESIEHHIISFIQNLYKIWSE